MVLTNRRGAKEEQRTDAVGASESRKADSQRQNGAFLTPAKDMHSNNRTGLPGLQNPLEITERHFPTFTV